MLEEMYEWYILLFDDYPDSDIQGGRESFQILVETMTPPGGVTGTSDGWSSYMKSDDFDPMFRPDGTRLLRWSGGHGSKWDNVGKPGLSFGLRTWQVLNFWNPSGKIAGGMAMAVEEGLIDEQGRWLSDLTTRDRD